MNSNAKSSAFKGNLLVVDDDSLIHDSLSLILPQSWRMISVKNSSGLPSEGHFHAAFVDMHLTKDVSRAEGPEVIRKIRAQFPLTEIYAMSGDLTIELMEEALAQGARKFLAKPLLPDEILSGLEKIEALWALRTSENRHRQTRSFQWIGTSPEAERIRYEISHLKGEKGPLLIEGETGTGKEVVAHLLNEQEDSRPFIAVNLGAIPETVFESEFFGHVRGAFTGADSLKIGLAEAAHGGDLFLDEIEALPLTQQAKLLRFLESGEIRKVGAKDSTHVKVRVIAASNQPLAELVKKGQFREDLLFRLTSRRLQLPQLSRRIEDIPLLAQFFLKEERHHGQKILSPEARLELKKYNWPGNVRELKRIMEQLALSSPLPIIRDVDVRRLLSPHSANADLGNEKISQVPTPASEGPLSQGLSALVENFEKKVMLQALSACKNDVDQAAELLQISRSNFYKKLKDYGIR